MTLPLSLSIVILIQRKYVNPAQKDTQFELLKDTLLPILAEASVGNFDLEVPLPPQADRNTNEILAGVGMLLDIIRQQQSSLDTSKRELVDSHQRTVKILSSVLDTTID